MPLSTFDDPEDKDKLNENTSPLSDQDEMEDIILLEELSGAFGHPSVSVAISSRFSPILDEPRDLPKDPCKALKKLLWMWWEDPQYPDSQKAISDCFGDTPALYYYALKHFSDPEFHFSAEEREDLARQLCHHAGCLTSAANNAFASPDNRILEFYWYFLVRLLTIEDKIRGLPKRPLTEEHMRLIHDQYAWFMHRLYDTKREGVVTIPSVYAWLEEKLINMGQTYPHLKPMLVLLLKSDIFDESSRKVNHLQQEVLDRYVALLDTEQKGGWEEEKLLQQDVQQLLNRLRGALTPEVETTSWQKPLEYLAESAKNKRIIYVDQAYAVSPSEEETLRAIEQIELELLKNVGSDDTPWVIANAQVRICPFHDCLEKKGSPQSLSEIMDLVEQYVNGQIKGASLQTFLALEGEYDLHVRDCLKYWEALRATRKRNPIFLRNGLLDRDRETIVQKALNTDRVVILGDDQLASMFLNSTIPSDDVLFVHHQEAFRDYPEDHVCVPGCMGYVAFELGQKHGWGEVDSSAISFLKNEHLVQAIFHEGMTETEVAEFTQTYTLPQFSDTEPTTWISKDIILFTKGDDDGESESHMSPVHSDSYVPVG